ncbi:MAG: TonB-dependent receptor [Cyclobacteriaceae bacterium]
MPPIIARSFVVLFTILSFGATALLAQKTTFPLDFREYSVAQLITELESQGYSFSYANDFLDKDRILSVTKDDIAYLIELICGDKLDYQLMGREILLFKAVKKKYTISGFIRDRSDGEALLGTTIRVLGSTEGIAANDYGYYALSLLPGQYHLAVEYVGYEPLLLDVDLKQDVQLELKLVPARLKLDEVVVTSFESDHEITGIRTSVNKIDMQLAGDIPYLLGEVDIYQSALLLPGIRNIGEDASGLNVRGGAVDENLILIDEATIYSSNHFYGLISVFNPDAIKGVTFFKGDVPSTYGGRVSSAIHVRQKEGNDQEMRLSGGLGLVSGRLMLEGPLKKDESSFLISARTSFFDYVSAISGLDDSRTNFQDYNAKINWRPNEKNHFYLSSYIGNDNNNDGLLIDRQWGNRTVTGRWNHIFSNRLFSNFTLSYSDYKYEVSNPEESGQFIGSSNVRNYSSKADFTWFISPRSTLEFGSGAILHRLNPGDRLPLNDDGFNNPVSIDSEHGLEPYVYANFQQNIGERWVMYYGLRYSSFYNFGPEDVYTYLPNQPMERGNITDTTSFSNGELIKDFQNLEPRVSINYNFGTGNTIKASYNRANQYIHLISNTITPSPTDIWKLSDTHIDPSFSDQYTLGYYKLIPELNLDFFAEAYFKSTDNIIEYKEGADLVLNETIETEVIQGNARAYGLELYLRKKVGRFRGWLSYTLSKSERQINAVDVTEQINNGDYFPSDFDRTHDFSLSGIYSINDRWTISSNFVYATGRPITFPEGKYVYDNIVLPSFNERNQFRLTDYHRLDISARLEGKKIRSNGKPKKKIDYWTFSIYNLYGRRNAYSYLFRQEEGSDQAEVVRYSILGTFIPSVTYNFRF